MQEAGTRALDGHAARPADDEGPPEDAVDDEDEDEDLQGSDDDDGEYNLKMFGIFQALPVDDGEPDWSQGEPATAEEYLRRVRHEAARCPQVVRVEPTAELQSLPPPAAAILVAGDIPEAPPWALPSRAWVVELVANFQQLRREVQEIFTAQSYPAAAYVPHINDEKAWDTLCFGWHAQQQQQQQQVLEAADGGDSGACDVTRTSPHVFSTIMALDSVEVAGLFARHTQQLVGSCPGSLPLLRAQWLFALAARLEKPLGPDESAAARALLRHCAQLRAGLPGPEDPLLPSVNVMIGIAGAYFGQDEQLCKLVEVQDLV